MALLIEVALHLLELKELLVIHRLEVCMLVYNDFILILFIHLHALLNDVDLFDREFYPAQLDDISSLHHIVNFVNTML